MVHRHHTSEESKAPPCRPARTGPIANQSASREKTIRKPRKNSQAVEQHFFYVTRGQTNAGFVQQFGEIYKAIGDDERELGAFGSLKAAADAVSASFGGAA